MKEVLLASSEVLGSGKGGEKRVEFQGRIPLINEQMRNRSV